MTSRALIVWAAVLLAVGAQAADDFAIRVYPVPKIDGKLTLDGELAEAAWQTAPLVSGFTGYEDNKLGEVQTGFRVLYDEQYLYFGIHCDEPNMARLQPLRVPRDEHGIFRTEMVELFLDPGHSHDLYYQLAFNVAGSLYDGERENVQWNSEAVVATHLGKDFWSVELAMPWSRLGGAATAGRMLGFNVNRTRHLGTGSEYMTWTQVQGAFHDPMRFAHLALSGTPEMIGKLGAELRKGDRSGPIQVYSAEGFSQQSYSQLAAAALADLDGLVNGLATVAAQEKSAAAATELGRRVAEHRAQVGQFRKRMEGKLDAAAWSRLEVEMQKMKVLLSTVVWDARLSALLSGF
ncbi:MAG: sugar-binding protein [Armatimonadia bacterium]